MENAESVCGLVTRYAAEGFLSGLESFQATCGFVARSSHLALHSSPFCGGVQRRKTAKSRLKRKEAFKGRQRRASLEITLWLVREDINIPKLKKRKSISLPLFDLDHFSVFNLHHCSHISSYKGLFGLLLSR